MAFWAYILHCSDGSYYTGHTDNLEHRIGQHQNGSISGYTFKRRPISLVWSESFETRDQAKVVEAQIKGWNKAKKEALISGNWDELVRLSNLKNDGA